MALINCSECGKEISDKAAACPNCGNPIEKQAQPTAATQQYTPPSFVQNYQPLQVPPRKPQFSFQDNAEKEKVAELSKGDTVTIIGKCTGETLGKAGITDCYFVE